MMLATQSSEGAFLLFLYLCLKPLSYILAFAIFGGVVLHRQKGVVFEHSIVGGVARWILGFALTIGWGVAVAWLRAPTGFLFAGIIALRLSLWWGLAALLFKAPLRHGLIFASIMTGLNIAADVLCFGLPDVSELGQPLDFGNLH